MPSKSGILKTSKIWTIPKPQLAAIVAESTSLSEVSRKIGLLAVTGVALKSIRKRIKDDGLDAAHFTGKPKSRRVWRGVALGEYLVENSTYSRNSLKRRLIKEGRLENKCAECGLGTVWNGKTIVLRLDHKNGVNNDNREENLRLLCPNCDSQQSTFSGANRPKLPHKTYHCRDCKAMIKRGALRCLACYRKGKEKIKWPSGDELAKMIQESNKRRVAQSLGVSWNALNHRMQRHGNISVLFV